MMDDSISKKVKIKGFSNCYNGYNDTYEKSYVIGVLEELPSPEKHEQWIDDCFYSVYHWAVRTVEQRWVKNGEC